MALSNQGLTRLLLEQKKKIRRRLTALLENAIFLRLIRAGRALSQQLRKKLNETGNHADKARDFGMFCLSLAPTIRAQR